MREKIEQALYLPEAMLEDMTSHAIRLDTGVSWCAQKAWQLAGAEVTAIPMLETNPRAEEIYERHYATGSKCRETLFFPADMLEQIVSAAAAQDRSLSWIVQRAWCLALDEIAALPAQT